MQLFDRALSDDRVLTLSIIAVDIERWLQINLKHFAKENPILILNFILTFSLLHFALVICLDVSRLGRFSHVHCWFDCAQTLHVKQMLLYVLTLSNVSVCTALSPHPF